MKRQSTGFKALDEITTGIVDASLVVVAARPGMGKTSFLLDLANRIEKNSGKTIAFFSLEDSALQVAAKLLIKDKKLTLDLIKCQDDKDKAFTLCQSFLKESKCKIYDDPDNSVEKMRSICLATENLGAILIDYVQLLNCSAYTKNSNRERQMETISQDLKALAQETNVPVICASQLSRTCYFRTDKRPQIGDFSYSQPLVRQADQVLFLYREGYFDENVKENMTTECIVAKNNFGETGTALLEYHPERLFFT